jgi:hypothetical protein
VAAKKQAKKTRRPRTSKVAKPAVQALVYRDPQGFYRYSAHDEDGKIVGDAEEGYRNRMYAGKIVRERYPGVRVSYA